MSDIVFSINIIMPMVALMAIGYILKNKHIISNEFVKNASSLCFRVFLPVSLFKNLYDSSLESIPYKLIIYALVSLLIQFIISVFITKNESKEVRGVMIQGMTRSNYAYIGIPLAVAMFTDQSLINEASLNVSLLSIPLIPLVNVLSVIALRAYGNSQKETNIKKIFLDVVKNPIIVGIVVGLFILIFRIFVPTSTFFIQNNLSFVYKTVQYLAQLATPLSLFVVGAGIEFKKGSENKKLMWTLIMKMVIFPAVTLIIGYSVFKFHGPSMATLVSAFASPVAVSSAIMVKEMDGDDILANNIVAATTVFSAFSLFVVITILRSVGCI